MLEMLTNNAFVLSHCFYFTSMSQIFAVPENNNFVQVSSKATIVSNLLTRLQERIATSVEEIAITNIVKIICNCRKCNNLQREQVGWFFVFWSK